MKKLLISIAIFLTVIHGREYVSPCATINVNASAGIFKGMGQKSPLMGRHIVSTRAYDSVTVDSTYFSKGSGGRSPNPQNAIIFVGNSQQCIDRFAGEQDSIFSFSLVDLPSDRWERVDSLMADTAFSSHHKYLCFDFSRDQKLSQAGKGTIRGRLAGDATLEVCECYTEIEGVKTPCVW